MRIFLKPPQTSRGLQRIADALTRYAPQGVEIVDNQANADLVILYAIGRCEALKERAGWLRQWGQKYAVIQCCLRSTQKPNTLDWWWLWSNARLVWSYYNLQHAILEDDWLVPDHEMRHFQNFYHAPLGADAGVFWPDQNVDKDFTIATSGLSYLSESVRECWLAAGIAHGNVFHVGPELRFRQPTNGIVFSNNCDDNWLSAYYQQCKYVSGLRRKEGFELPAVEGLLCGARPILFDNPDFVHWYRPWGVFIKETDRQGVIDQLVEIFCGGYHLPVTEEEVAAARERFNWQTIIGGFYERILR